MDNNDPVPHESAEAEVGAAEDGAALDLVIGLVAPIGVDLDLVSDLVRSRIGSYDYSTEVVRLSNLLQAHFGNESDFSSIFERSDALMDMGTFLKSKTGQADILARLAITYIRNRRKDSPSPRVGRAWIIRSFKRSEEVDLFRSLYGDQFVLVSIYSSQGARTDYLKRLQGPAYVNEKGEDAETIARRLIKKDRDETGMPHGQQVGKVFPLADYFVTVDARPELEKQVDRLAKLIFGHPYESPSKEEGMYLAQAAAFRSLDLARQVGAAIVNDEGDVITTGCNEVPKAGGGQYWSSDITKARDFEIGYDSSDILKRQILTDAFLRLKKAGWLDSTRRERSIKDLLTEALESEAAFMKDSSFFDVIEFGRSVHAEMAAICSASRQGKRIQGARLFCTTFPCHICARHIVASGVREVYFIEPYEKSRVQQMYPDSIVIEPSGPCRDLVAFRAFVGVAPRRYADFFQSRGKKKSAGGRVLDSIGILKYKEVKKKIFHIRRLEAKIIEEIHDAPPWGEFLIYRSELHGNEDNQGANHTAQGRD